VIVASPLNTQH